MSFIKSKLSKVKSLLIIFTSLLLFSAVPYFLGPGLLTPKPIAPYLNGNFPTLSAANEEPYRVAFENLSFFYPITFKIVPNQDKVVLGQLDGKIFWFDNDEDTAQKNLLLDLSNEVGIVSDGGFLGLTIHPNFGNGDNYFYVYYATKNWNGENSPGFGEYTTQACFSEEYEGNFLILERFEVNPITMNFVVNSRTTVLKNRMYGTTHRGGGLDFGDDGFLYLTTGDQTSWQKAQDYTSNLDGGVLRIDVDKDPTKSHVPIRKKPNHAGQSDEISGIEYWIPNDNPFLSPSGSNFEEYWSVGLRNPHRMTKDTETGTFYIGEVGLDTHEEINILGKGKNYGWPLFEGNIPGPGCVTQLLNNMPHNNPLVSFSPQEANSIIGGYVYRGSEIPELYGKYICADFGVGDEIWSVDILTGQYELLGNFLPEDVISFGQDTDGEIFILKGGFNTQIYKMKSSTISYEFFPQLLSETGVFTDLNTLEVTDGIVPYDIVESFWSDGALKKRWIAIPNDGTHDTAEEKINYSENGDWEFSIGSVLIKHFDLQIDDNNPNITRKIETRFSIMGQDGKFYFLTYNWNEDQTDAVLQGFELDETINITTTEGGTRTQTWHFPSNTECFICHNNATKGGLGLRTRYLNKNYTYDETGITANQLVTLSHLGILDENITDADTQSFLTGKSIYDASATLDEKARSYLDLNCAYCHRPDTDNRAAFDLRLFNSLEATELLNAGILSPLGIPDEKIVYPGDASKSILFHRMNTVNPGTMMPPIAKSIVDQDAVNIIEQWINELETPTTTLNSPDESINLALLASAQHSGSITDGRGSLKEILYDPRIDDYFINTPYNEYGVDFGEDLGVVDIDDAFEWRVDWPSLKNINYITFGGAFANQPQPNTMWRISYLNDGNWTTLDEGQGGWIDGGIFEWGNSFQTPIQAEAVRVQAYSDGVNNLVSIHFRGRGGISTVDDDDSATNPKAALFQYLPLSTSCGISSIVAGIQSNCVSINNTYTQDIEVHYVNAPNTGDLVVNGQVFPITGSPQSVTLNDLNSNGLDVDITANFSTETGCNFLAEGLFTAPSRCNLSGIPDNTPDDNSNLGLIPEAVLTGSTANERGTPKVILYDPSISNYAIITDYNEYGVNFGANLGTPNADNGFKWQVNWPNPKYVNYITFGGSYQNQPQPNSMWRISYSINGEWITIDEGQGEWIDNDGIFEWGGSSQQPVIADALRVQVYSDGTHDLVSIHLRARGGTSNNVDDTATTTKATLIQYVPLNDTCGLSIPPDAYLYCNNTWKDGNHPNETTDIKDIYIGNGTFVVNEDENIKVHDLEISIDAAIIIKEGGSITVHGDLINDGSVQLESTSTKYSSLVVEGISTGNIFYKRHVNAFNGVTGNDLISSPLKGDNFGNFVAKNSNLYENPSNTNQKLFGPFDETTGNYSMYSTLEDADTNLILGKGYRAARDNNEDLVSGITLTFTGEIETNAVSSDITTSSTSFGGWNLIGNPYPSYIDFDAFFQHNIMQLDAASYQAVYGYDGDANDGWKVLNNATTNLLIAPGQGFFVKSKAGGGTITFTPEMRVGGSSDDFILGRTTASYFGHLRLNINANNLNYNTEFYFNSNASAGLDPGYDAGVFGENPPAFSIYSQLVQDNVGIAFTVQALSNSNMNDITIPLGINANQGQNITFSIAESDIPGSINIYLEDRLNNIFTLLNNNDYSFTADTNLSSTGRFYLRFESDALSIVEQSLEGLQIYADATNKAININGQLHSRTNFNIYDINGRILTTKPLEITSTYQSIDVSQLSTGIYIVELISNTNEKRIEKLIIK